MKDKVLAWLRSGKDLPVLSSTATKVMQLAVKGTVSEKLAAAILESPALTAKVLRLVNSPFYGFSQKVSTVQHAIVLLGFKTVSNLVLSISMIDAFAFEKSGSFSHKKFCRDAFCSAIAADMIARQCGETDFEECFVLGLLHDIGEMVIARFDPESFQDILKDSECNKRSKLEAERLVIGADHAELGEIVSRAWKLPNHILTAIRHHHEPDVELSDAKTKRLCSILYLSDIMVEIFRGEDGSKSSRFAKEAERLLGFNQDRTNLILFAFAGKVKESAKVFEIGSLEIKDYSDILQEANERLGEINVEYDSLIRKLEEQQGILAKESARVNESEQKYRLLFENASDGIAVLDLKGYVLEANQQLCMMLGLKKDGICGLPLSDFILEKDEQRLLGAFETLRKKSMSFRKGFEIGIRNAIGEERQIEIKLNGLEEKGHIWAFQAILTDVTERKQEEVLRIQKEKLAAVIEMASGASHELAQPMTALLGLIDLLMVRISPTDEHRETIETLSKLTDKMVDITQKLGKITRYIIKEYPGGIKIVDIHEASKPLRFNS